MLKKWLNKLNIAVSWRLWRFQARRALQYGKKVKGITAGKSDNIYYSIEVLPFDKFLDRLINSNHRALVIKQDDTQPFSGEQPINLIEAWEQIYTDFTQLMGEGANVAHIHILADIARLESKVDRIYAIMSSLKMFFNPELVEQLKKAGIRNPPTPEDLKEEIIEAETKQWIIQIHERKVSYISKIVKENNDVIKQALVDADYDITGAINILQPESKKNVHTYDMYDKILARIEPTLQPKDITTARFCRLYNDLRRKIKAQEDGIRANR